MERSTILSLVLILCITIAPVHGQYHSKTVPSSPMKEKVTRLHFYFHDILSGPNPGAIQVAGPNTSNGESPVSPFGSVFVVNDPLTLGPEPTSGLIGNAQGLYVSSGSSVVIYIDFGFTTGKFNGSSISIFSRNPILETGRELAVVGGRGRFRMAKGFAQIQTTSVNTITGDVSIEYNVTIYHY